MRNSGRHSVNVFNISIISPDEIVYPTVKYFTLAKFFPKNISTQSNKERTNFCLINIFYIYFYIPSNTVL